MTTISRRSAVAGAIAGVVATGGAATWLSRLGSVTGIVDTAKHFREGWETVEFFVKKYNEIIAQAKKNGEIVTDQSIAAPDHRNLTDKQVVDIGHIPVNAIVKIPMSASVQFDIRQYLVSNCRDFQVFASVMSHFVADIRQANRSLSLPLWAEFFGLSDAVGKGTVTSVLYKGEYGDISRDKVKMNGVDEDIRIWNGKRVSNCELAFLRAFGLMDLAIKNLNDVGMSEQDFSHLAVSASESDQVGKKFRLAKVSIRFMTQSDQGADV